MGIADHSAYVYWLIESAPPLADEYDDDVDDVFALATVSNGQALAFESIDTELAEGAYVYFGQVSASCVSEHEFPGGATTVVDFSPLDPPNARADVLVMMLGSAIQSGNGYAFIQATAHRGNTNVGTYSLIDSPANPPSVTGQPAFIALDIDRVVFTAELGTIALGGGDASAACGVIEINTDTSTHNDCDIDNDGDTDADDIDLLTLALNSDVGATGNATAIAMFDVNSDAAVSEPNGRNSLAQMAANPALVAGDMDELIHTCLGTEYGDANLDGKVGGADQSKVLLNWGMTGAGWADGDMSGDGVVSQPDLDMVSLNWGFGY